MVDVGMPAAYGLKERTKKKREALLRCRPSGTRAGITADEKARIANRQVFEPRAPHGVRDNIKWVKKQAKSLKGDPNESIAYLRAKAINTLINKSADVFWENREDILKGDYDKILIESIPELKTAMKKIYDTSIKKIYNAKNVVQLEIAGFRIMSALVEDFVTSALTAEGTRDKEQYKILGLLPEQFSIDESSSPYEKVMSIIDFIAGMTDLYALKLYRKLRGIEI